MLEVYTDAATVGNPGSSAVGIYIKKGKLNEEYQFLIGEYSNHEAEFIAVIKALEICKEKYPEEILSFRSDSRIVVDSIEKEYATKKEFLKLLEEIKSMTPTFPYFFIKWIPEKQNKIADQLARKALLKL
ncbi:ribonuclease HI family protein [Saliterribacillus persicus]|uniref:RNase HI n=1 Tax=Saliterribacillus persicus TaxID=930114 RepID=A0A368XD68_9BACI|nr:ribonuclease HI family protein [Saliterribacillus persicus]RCW64958.1 RNase HI [Saliterribacillus persicus]